MEHAVYVTVRKRNNLTTIVGARLPFRDILVKFASNKYCQICYILQYVTSDYNMLQVIMLPHCDIITFIWSFP